MSSSQIQSHLIQLLRSALWEKTKELNAMINMQRHPNHACHTYEYLGDINDRDFNNCDNTGLANSTLDQTLVDREIKPIPLKLLPRTSSRN